ncbi:serine/threonine protein phosphatase [Leptolyngbyaceae cyanobacterium JSC-12]|nr:serine/threonine protein phosphatase [Leptolyngbyaceae cyanobacterium JSC-12]
MLICPQCQFENPTDNKFCQRCGTSLTQNTCAECGELVPFDQMNCGECGAEAGVVWWAIIAPNPSALEPLPSMPQASIGFSGYLDLQQRYQILEPFSPPNELGEQQGLVLDCQPFQLSVLEALVLKNLDDAPNDFSQNLLNEDFVDTNPWTDSMEALSLPAIAQPYIALNSQLYHALPAIHNAWQSEQQTVLLLEDRSCYPTLVDIWQDDEAVPPTLQILHWLYQMVELWDAMEPWRCQQSLLVLNNLRINLEDQVLCLQRLYWNPTDDALPLQELGRMWRMMFAESQKTCVEVFSQLLVDVEDQKLATVEAVQARIEAIAQTLQPQPTTSTASESSVDDHFGFQQSPCSLGTADMSTANAPTRLEMSTDEEEDDTQLDSDDMPTIVLPMQLFNLEEVGRTDVGRQREHNEDYFGIETQVVKLESPSGKTLHARNLYILCDGMGGHAGGEVASALAVDTIRNYFKEKWQQNPFPGTGNDEMPDAATITEAVLHANKAIFDVNQQHARSGSGRMGTTLVVVLIYDTDVAVAHVGDSRLYRFTRKRGLEQVTTDHEVGQREIQRGIDPQAAYSRPDAYQLTQALGPRDEHFVKPDIQFFELSEDMLLLLCSDGLSDNDLLEKHWESHVQPLLSSQTNLDKGVSELIELANQYNGHDNVTAIAIRAKVRPSLEHLR